MFCPKTLLLLLSVSLSLSGHYANNSIPKRGLVPFDNTGRREDVDGLLHAIMVVCGCDLCVISGASERCLARLLL